MRVTRLWTGLAGLAGRFFSAGRRWPGAAGRAISVAWTSAGRLLATVGRWFGRLWVKAGRAWPRPEVKLHEASIGRRIVVSTLLGVVLTWLSFTVYERATALPDPPDVSGAGEVYVSDPSVTAILSAQFALEDISHQRSPMRMTLVLVGKPRPDPVSWAVVLTGDARPAADSKTEMTPGTQVASVVIGDPPFAANPARVDAQVFHGQVSFRYLRATTTAVTLSMDLPVAVADRAGPEQLLSLPRYGRVRLAPGFTFPGAQGAIDLGIPGNWFRPKTFSVDVDAGANPPGQRTDIVTPDLSDPTALDWDSTEAVQAVLQRTDLRRESRQQTVVFVLGAVVGAAASVLLTVIETLFGSVRVSRRRPGAPSPPTPPDGH